MKQGSVRLGVAGWLRQEWEGSFYPADMPPEWQLTFYGTQYACVWLNRAQWCAAHPEEIASWVAEVHDVFQFLLESPGSPSPDERVRLAAFAGRAVPLEAAASCVIWFGAGEDLRALTQAIQQHPEDEDLYLLSRDGDLATLDQVGTLLGLLGIGSG